jgi:regulator of PEP synthase PpsR (kinase-PPPase family)
VEYYRRVEAIEFAVQHDDGRNPQDLLLADIVLIGSSRTSKTPVSIYLATHGYKTANVTLAPGMEPPKELFWVKKHRVFGLTSQPELLANIRHRRLGDVQMGVAGSYASIEYVQEDLKEARQLMQKLGCIVLRTDNRAIEETVVELLHYYHQAIQPV